METTLQSFKQMDALYPGKCKFCGQRIEKGEPILYYSREHKIAHNVSRKCRDYKTDLAKSIAYSQMIVKQEQEQRNARIAKANAPVIITEPVLRDGYYTVVFDFDGQTRHKTFHVFTGKEGRFGEGRQMVSVFLGTENTEDTSYQTFAFLNGATLSVWKRFALYHHEIAAIQYLLDGEHAEAAGILYATESCKCRRCGRLLTNPTSIIDNQGYGPECIKKI